MKLTIREKSPAYYIGKIEFLINKNLALFRHHFGWTREDLVQELTMVLLRAQGKHRYNGGAAFDTYAIQSLKNYVQDLRRTCARKKRERIEVPLNDQSDTDSYDYSEILGSDCLTPEELLLQQEELAELGARLNDAERQVYVLLLHTEGDFARVKTYLGLTDLQLNRYIISIRETLGWTPIT